MNGAARSKPALSKRLKAHTRDLAGGATARSTMPGRSKWPSVRIHFGSSAIEASESNRLPT